MGRLDGARLREAVFGSQDGLVSTLGAITGIAAGTGSSGMVLLSGAVIVVVESLSMAAGSYLSSKSHRQYLEYQIRQGRGHDQGVCPDTLEEPADNAWVKGTAYVAGGLIPVLPYAFLPIRAAMPVSIAGTAAALFVIGFWKGRVVHQPRLRSGLEMLGIAGLAAIAGFVVGHLAGKVF